MLIAVVSHLISSAHLADLFFFPEVTQCSAESWEWFSSSAWACGPQPSLLYACVGEGSVDPSELALDTKWALLLKEDPLAGQPHFHNSPVEWHRNY